MTVMLNTELERAAISASVAAQVLLDVAHLAELALKQTALEEAETVTVRAAIDAAALVERAAREAEAVLKQARGVAAALVIERINATHPPQSWASTVGLWVSSSTFVMAAALLLLVLWWAVYPYRGIRTFTLTSHEKVVQAGTLYEWTASYCLDDDVPLPISIEREVAMENGHGRYPLQQLNYVVQKQCEEYQRSVVIPESLPSGTYRLIVSTSVQVNPLRTIRQSFQGDKFQVVAK